MAVVNISLPDQLKHYVADRVNEGGYGTTSEYIRDLIREDQKRQSQEKLEMLLLEGLETPGKLWTSNDVADIKRLVRDRLSSKSPKT